MAIVLIKKTLSVKEEFTLRGTGSRVHFTLVYEIECDYRADSLIRPVLKRGHSNWLEASHNVFKRHQPGEVKPGEVKHDLHVREARSKVSLDT